jgi:spore germination protein KA
LKGRAALFDRKRKQAPKPEDDTAPEQAGGLSVSLEENVKRMDSLFDRVSTMLSRRFQNAESKAEFCIYFSDGITNSMLVNEHLVEPLILSRELRRGGGLFEQVKSQAVQANYVTESTDLNEIIEAITYGDTLLLVDGSSKGLLISSKNFSLRGITEPEGEKVLSGPREGFTEGIMMNLSMLRRRLRTSDLKLEFQALGRHSKTAVCIAYMDNIVNKRILRELQRRLKHIDMDCVLDSNYLVEYIAEKSFLGLNTTGATERPDVITAKLMEGRIAVFVDGSPVVLTVPYLMIENFQSNEDYYMNPIYASYGRILRILCFFMAILIPGVYIAVVGYHHEILPSSLMLSFAGGRQSVPLPASIECFIMLVVFDILRETGVRMPGHLGSALSIVGALVIGQSAVEAKLVAAPMVIVVAISGITILLVPRLSTTGLLMRYGCLILGSSLGFAGIVIGVSILVTHIFNLESYGIPLLTPTQRLHYQDVKDTFFRAPWPRMLTRFQPLTDNVTRAKKL